MTTEPIRVSRRPPATASTTVGFDAHVLDGRFQGSRTVIARLAQNLARDQADIEVTLYCATPPDLGPRVGHGALPRGGAWRRLFVDLPRIARRDRLDALIYQYICAPWSRNSWVVIHDVLPITHARLFGAAFVIRSAILFILSMIWARRVIVVSQYTADRVKRVAPFASHKLTVVRNGPSFDEDVYFTPRPAARSTPYILTVGRLEKRKNVDMLVKAFVKAQIPDVELVIVGKAEPGYEIALDAPNVVSVTNADDAALADLYANAALFVYPSSAEGFGLPLLDAILFGAPTLSSKLTAMPEVGGNLAEYFDPSAADAVETLSERMRAHFSGRPVLAPTPQQRRAHANAFSWRHSAAALADALRTQRPAAR